MVARRVEHASREKWRLGKILALPVPLREGPPSTVKSVLSALLLSASVVSAVDLTFEKDVRPILKTHCTHCHGEEEKPDAGLDLRLRRFMDKVLDGDVRVVVPGKPADSGMIKMIRSGKMPKKGKKMPEADLAVLERWIAEGARDDGG